MALLPVNEALERVLDLCVPLDRERVRIDDAVGRVTAEDVLAVRTLPPWNNSAMDGYALRSVDVTQAPRRLAVVETIHAGQTPKRTLEAGQAARIMTGAPLPTGADAVVMQEKANRLDEETVEILESVGPGTHVREAGEDVKAGALLLVQGTPLGLPEAAALWAQGLDHVTVHQRPRVAIASSGDELCAVGEAPEGRIVDTNSPVMALGVRRAGGIATPLGVAKDRLDAVTALFEKGLSYDVLVTVSGASVGEKDFAQTALADLGVPMDFWKVAMKPGKPLAVGRKNGTLVFSLPGNPTSALVTFELFVRPALRALQGLSPAWPVVPGRAAVDVKRGAALGLTHFIRCRVESREGSLWATPLTSQSSGAHASAVGATHLLRVPPTADVLAAGAPVDLIPVSWNA
jgi:molybdopterin molybdotransferase